MYKNDCSVEKSLIFFHMVHFFCKKLKYEQSKNQIFFLTLSFPNRKTIDL